MAPEGITRRRALGIGAAAVAAVGLRPSVSLAGTRGPALFEMPIGPSVASAASAGWHTTGTLAAPRRFDLVGVRWKHASPDLRIQVRTRPTGGSWTRWAELHLHADHAPDDGPPPTGSDPAWVGDADDLQLRIWGSVDGLRARFVRARPTATTAHRLARRLHRRGAARAATVTPAPAGATAAPAIITRAEWGGTTVPPRSAPDIGEVRMAFVHHTVTLNDYGPDESASIVLGIARYHRDGNGWNDLGYNFLVDRHGQIFEGRAGGMELAIVGAQAQGYNSLSTGVACLGEFTAAGLPDPGVDALSRLLAWKLALHAVPAEGTVELTSAGGASNRFPSGRVVTFARISGHRDGNSTSCPGNALYAQLPGLRALVASRTRTRPTGLTLTAEDKEVAYPTRLPLTGGLTFADGTPGGGQVIRIQFQAAGSAWQEIASVTTDSAGGWELNVRPPLSGLIRAFYAGVPGQGEQTSPPVSVAVTPRVDLRLSSGRVRRGARIGVTSTLKPRISTKVQITTQRQVRGNKWVTVASKMVTARNGELSSALRLYKPGLYRITAGVPGASRAKRVRVVR